jgi:hypothetical protein
MEFKGPPYLVDGHVHLHPCFDEARFFAAAASNFAAEGHALGLSSPPCGILMLTESSGSNRFVDLGRSASNQQAASYQLGTTAEDQSLFVTVHGRSPMMIVAGRQVVTSEDLEVLALGCVEELPDGGPLETTLGLVRDAGAIPVVPWGFGKWHSSRRTALLEVLHRQPSGGVFLGDNGGRARWLPKPGVFQTGAEMGLRNLPGSDPLPFSREETRAGSYGFVFDRPLDPREPAADLLRHLAQSEEQYQTFGTGLGAHTFVLNQIGMQIRKRLRGKRP